MLLTDKTDIQSKSDKETSNNNKGKNLPGRHNNP